MGMVYSARNGDNAEIVAIKMVSRGMDTATVIRRFHQEQHILANLDHPNIARIYDGGTTDDGRPYFVMEYVEGQPIDVYCRDRVLSAEDRLRLFLRICAAVDTAHQKLVVHRDIKPNNILVSKNGEPKLLDFGIAKIFNAEHGATMTMATRVMTPAYASPEQVRGERVTPATDVYALGVLLYELLTGERPYRLQTHSSEEMVRVVCEQEPPKPSTYWPMSAALDDIVLKALRKEPSRRYQTAAEFADDVQAYFEGRPVAASRDSRRYRTGRYFKQHQRAVGVGVVALVIAAAGIPVAIRWSRGPAADRQSNAVSTASTSIKPRQSIAVLGFRNLSNRSDAGWLSTALSEMFTTELAAGGQLRTIRLENVSQLKSDFAVNDNETVPKETFSKFRKTLGADLLVDGSYLILGQSNQLRVDLRVTNPQEDVVMAVSETGPETDLFTIVSKAGSRLRAELGLSETGASDVSRARAAFPKDAEVVRLYTEGLQKLRVFDAIAALPLLQKAAELDSMRPLVYSALSEAWTRLGYDSKAAETAKKAYELTEGFSRGERLSEDRLSIEGRYRVSQKDWEKATDVYKTLWRFFPDDAEYGLRLATVQIAAGKAKDALATVQSMRQLPAPGSEDPRIDIAEADAFSVLSDYKQQQQAYARAAKKARATGARLLLARALLSEGWTMFTLGQTEDAVKMSEEAQALYTTAGDRSGIAASLINIGAVLSQGNNLMAGMQRTQEALAISREIGDKRTTASAMNTLGVRLKDQRRYEEAARMYEGSLAIRREIDDKAGAAATLSNLGVAFYEQDRFVEAAKRYEESLQISRELGDRRGIVRVLHNLASVKKELGELKDAQKALRDSLALRKEIGDKRGQSVGLIELAHAELRLGNLSSAKQSIDEGLSIARETKYRSAESTLAYMLGDISLEEGDLAGARKNHEAALAIRKEMREDRTIVTSRLALANLALEDGRAAEAEATAHELQTSVSHEGPAVQAMIDLVEARALLAQKKIAAAAAALKRAKTRSAATQRYSLRTMVEIAAARLEIAQKQPQAAMQHLTSLVPALERNGDVQLLLEIRLAQCEAQVQLGPNAAARACSTALENDARARGFGRVAQRARTLVSSSM